MNQSRRTKRRQKKRVVLAIRASLVSMPFVSGLQQSDDQGHIACIKSYTV